MGEGGHEMGRHGSVRSKNQIDLSLRTRCVVLKQSWKSEFLASWSSRVGTDCTQTIVLSVKRVVVAPFELELGANGSYRRATSVGTPPGAKTAQIRATILVKLPTHRPELPKRTTNTRCGGRALAFSIVDKKAEKYEQ